jgi:clan AA aspartic protease (TIGR02281 family)
MEEVNGIYVMPCKVNGLNLKFIFDTGASAVSISLTEALFMIKNEYLSQEDLRGATYHELANGDIEEGTKVILNKLEIGNLALTNVEASIVHSLDAPLLLGQSALSRLGKIQFDYSNNTLTIITGSTSIVSTTTTTTNSNYKSSSSDRSTYNPPNSKYITNSAGKYKVHMGTLLYSTPGGKKIIQVTANTFASVIEKNTSYSDYWYVEYEGFKGYILKIAFEFN